MKATYESKDQNYTDEQTIYWFDVVGNGSFIHGGKFGVVKDKTQALSTMRARQLKVCFTSIQFGRH